MRKFTLLLYFLFLFALNNPVNAQLTDGSIAPNFTAQSLDGTSHELYEYLDEGQGVILHMGASWSNPCWDYTETQTLNEFWELVGPSNLDQARVFFIETDPNSDDACLYGCGLPTPTPGVWTDAIQFPIIDGAGGGDEIAELYAVSDFPTIYWVYPDYSIYEMGELGLSEILDFITENAPADSTGNSMEVPPVPDMSLYVDNCTGTLSFIGYGSPEPDTWSWDFGNDTIIENQVNGEMTYQESGTYEVSLEVCNEFGCNTITETIIVNIDSTDVSCNQFFMPQEGIESLTDCGMTLYDSGGPNDNYALNSNSSLLINAPNPEELVVMTFVEFDTEDGFDFLYIYDGNSTEEEDLLFSLTGSELPNNGEPIFSTGNALTLVFSSDPFFATEGWEAIVSCYEVDSPPVPDFEFVVDECTGNVAFEGTVFPNPDSWSWDFGDGTVLESEDNAEHTYTDSGTYEVSLEVCNEFGCNTINQTIEVNIDTEAPICFEYMMPTAGVETVTTCNLTLYDSGGPNGEYLNSENGTLIIQAPEANQQVLMTFNEFELENGFDYLNIYDGSEVAPDSSNLLFSLTNGDLPNDGNPIIGTGNALTIVFTSDGSVTRPGWEASISCVSQDYVITAIAFNDENGNGVLDENESLLLDQLITLEPDGLAGFTNAEGSSTFFIEANSDYSLTYGEGGLWSTEESTINISTGSEPYNETIYFPLTPVGNFSVNNLDLTSAITRCNMNVNYWLTYSNAGTTINSGYVQLIPDELASFVFASPAPDSISNGTLYWFYEDLAPTFSEQIVLQFGMPNADFIGETIDFEANIKNWDGSGGDKAVLSSDLVCSFDPNDKLAEPSNYGSNNYTLFSDSLEYTVRFQNTGNDTAFVITILDELDENLDLNTFRVISSSHEVNATVDMNTRVATFLFEDIYLPDSFINEPASHGFVKYRVLSKAGISENTIIENTAGIYFDSNDPIITNTVENTMVSVLPALPVIASTPLDLDFGHVAVGETEKEIIVIYNPGELDLEVNELLIESNFFDVENTTYVVPGGGEIEVEVSFSPAEEINYQGVLLLRSNGGDLPVSLQGIGGEEIGLYEIDWRFSVSPNPSNGLFELNWKGTNNLQNAKIKVYDASGKLVLSERMHGNSSKINLSAESQGLYFLYLESDQINIIQKLIVE